MRAPAAPCWNRATPRGIECVAETELAIRSVGRSVAAPCVRGLAERPAGCEAAEVPAHGVHGSHHRLLSRASHRLGVRRKRAFGRRNCWGWTVQPCLCRGCGPHWNVSRSVCPLHRAGRGSSQTVVRDVRPRCRSRPASMASWRFREIPSVARSCHAAAGPTAKHRWMRRRNSSIRATPRPTATATESRSRGAPSRRASTRQTKPVWLRLQRGSTRRAFGVRERPSASGACVPNALTIEFALRSSPCGANLGGRWRGAPRHRRLRRLCRHLRFGSERRRAGPCLGPRHGVFRRRRIPATRGGSGLVETRWSRERPDSVSASMGALCTSPGASFATRSRRERSAHGVCGRPGRELSDQSLRRIGQPRRELAGSVLGSDDVETTVLRDTSPESATGGHRGFGIWAVDSGQGHSSVTVHSW